MKLKFLDGSITDCQNIEEVSGNLLITHTGKTLEEIKEIYGNKASLHTITLLTDSKKEAGIKTGYVTLAGATTPDCEAVTVTLVQETDSNSARITQALADAVEAVTHSRQAAQEAETAGQMALSTHDKLEAMQAGIDMAIAEITMVIAGSMEGGAADVIQ